MHGLLPRLAMACPSMEQGGWQLGTVLLCVDGACRGAGEVQVGGCVGKATNLALIGTMWVEASW